MSRTLLAVWWALLGACALAGASPAPPSPAGSAHAAPPAGPPAPAPAGVTELVAHRASGVVTAWLGNGVHVAHKRSTAEPGRVRVVLTLAGGELFETEANLGVSHLAATAWITRGGTTAASAEPGGPAGSGEIETHGSGGPDALVLKVSAPADRLVEALTRARELLQEPRVEPAAFERHRARAIREQARLQAEPRAVLAAEVVRVLYPPDQARFRFVTRADLERLTPAQAESWLRRHTVEEPAPLAVAVIGDIALADALLAVERTLGTLPARARIAPTTHRALREVPQPDLPRSSRTTSTLLTGDNRAIVAVGCYAGEGPGLRRTRALALGCRVLERRVWSRLEGAGCDAAPVKAWTLPPGAQPGRSMVTAMVLVPPEQAARAAQALAEEMGRLAGEPPADAELDGVRKGVLEKLPREDDVGYWAMVLSAAPYRGHAPDDLARVREDFETIGPHEVREAWAAAWRGGALLDVIILPALP